MTLSIRAHLYRLAKSKKPILIGPWRSELGFETLYFLPWLAQWREHYQIPKERLIVLSRGGAACWYDAGQTAELYDYTPISAVRQAMLVDAAQTKSIKQQRISTWETALLNLVAEQLGLRRYHVLHPSLMYQSLAGWWDNTMSLSAVMPQLRFEPIKAPYPPLDIPLPEKFLAVSFYARHTWPLDDERKAWVLQQIDHLTKHIPIVILDSGFHADDHVAFPIDQTQNVIKLAPYLTPQNNLAVQSAVLAKAIGFCGTYGGLMQLAVRLGKPAVGFFHKFEGTAYAHKAITEWLAVQQGTPCFIGRPDDARYVRELLP
jgi:hypothetical protein